MRQFSWWHYLYTTHVCSLLEFSSVVWNTGYTGDIKLLKSVKWRWTRNTHTLKLRGWHFFLLCIINFITCVSYGLKSFLFVDILEGAALEVSEAGVTFRLQANSAVLYFLQKTDQASNNDGKNDVEAWLEWESSQLQVCWPALISSFFLDFFCGGGQSTFFIFFLCTLPHLFLWISLHLNYFSLLHCATLGNLVFLYLNVK